MKSQFKNLSVFIALAMLAGLLSLNAGLATPASAEDTTEIVAEVYVTRQAEGTLPTDNWVIYTRPAAPGTATFRTGPAGQPLGSGSLELATSGSSNKVFAYNFDHVGTLLSDIDAMSYSTYRTAGNLQQVTSLNIQVDANGPADGGFTTLVFEPVYNTDQGIVLSGQWQDWDAYNGGLARWWSTRDIPGVCASNCFIPWGLIVGANPDATILGGFGVNQGSGNPGLVTAVDALTIGYGGDSVTYDFEVESCSFTTSGTTMTLNGDCTTDHTILVPDGFTLDGNGHTITAVDPFGGHFVGAVVKNAGAIAHVANLTVTTDDLANTCDGGDFRLRGILLEGAAGSITNNTVLNINQGASGCQEGNAIEVRNAPFDNTGPDLEVTITGNLVDDYQKTGIVANGSVAATITGNTITGVGPVTYIAQNGIQVGFGGTATLRDNSVSGNDYTPENTVSCGLLYYDADGVRSSRNTLFANERDVCNFGKGGGTYNPEP